MKTTANITIMSLLLTLVMMVSCSTEGDVLDEMTQVETPATSGVAAAISCSINQVMTKAGSETQPAGDKNEAVQRVLFFLMKGNQVLGYKEDAKATIYTKKQSGLTVIAVANASDATRTALVKATTRESIYAITSGVADLESLIKIGESGEITEFIEEGSTVTANASVAVNQLTARIDLNKLTVNVKATDNKVVKLTGVTLKNQNTTGLMSGKAAGFIARNIQGTIRTNELNSGVAYDDICHFYTFANETTATPTTMVLSFEVDGISSSREFKIKHINEGNMVKSGYLYRLNVTVNLSGENVEPEVTFEVADWKTSTVTGDLEEIKK